MKKFAVVEVKHLGMEGVGRNATLAKQDAERKIERFVSDNHGLTILEGREHIVIIYREVTGYAYSFTLKSAQIKYNMHPSVTIGFDDEDRDDIILQAISHLAQAEWDFEQGEDFSMWTLPYGKPLPDQALKNLQYWARWQLGYWYARNVIGNTDAESHRQADDVWARMGTLFLVEAYKERKGGDAK